MRLVTFPELKTEFGIRFCRSYVYRIERAGQFPKRVQLGPNAVAWVAEEIAAFVQTRLDARHG